MPTPSPQRVLPVLFLGVLMAALDIAIVGPALPAIQEHFELTERDIAWVFNMFVLLNLMGLPLMAKLSDMLGRRVIYTLDVLLFGVGSLIVALSPSFAVLLIGRGIQGLAASGIFPVGSAVIGDIFPPEKRGRALGVLGAVYGVAFIIGPILAGILLKVGWWWLFYVNVPLAILVAVLGARMLPSGRATTHKTIDWKGILTLGGGLVSLAYGISQLDTEAFGESLMSSQTWPFFLSAIVLLSLFVAVEKRASNPVLRLQLMRNKQVVLASMLAAGAGLTEAAFIFFPALAVAAFAVTKSAASFMLLPLVFAVAIGSPVAGRILDRVGSRSIVLMGTSCLTIGLAMVGFMPAQKGAFYAGSVLIGFGLAALLGSALSYILLAESKEAERTVAQGIITLFISIGQMTGSALIGAVAASGDDEVAGYASAFLAIAAVALVLTLLGFGLKKRATELRTAQTD